MANTLGHPPCNNTNTSPLAHARHSRAVCQPLPLPLPPLPPAAGKPQCTLLPCNVFNALAWRESQALEKEFGGWGLQTYATFHRAADPEATVQNVNGFLRGAFACRELGGACLARLGRLGWAGGAAL